LHVGVATASDVGGHHTIASKVQMVRAELAMLLAELRTLDPARVERSIKEFQSPSHGFSWDFGVFVEDLEKAVHKTHRFRQIVNIVSWALLGRGVMARRGGGGGGPTFTGGPTLGGATAIAVTSGAVVSVEWAEALRRLVAIGAISSVAAGGAIGKPPPAPA